MRKLSTHRFPWKLQFRNSKGVWITQQHYQDKPQIHYKQALVLPNGFEFYFDGEWKDYRLVKL